MKTVAPSNETVANVKVGTPDTVLTSPSHVAGISGGNDPGVNPGIEDKGTMATGTAQRSTGINPQSLNPIDPKMPNLSPA